MTLENTNQAETKADRFKRIANPRLNNVLKAIDTLEKCCERDSYEYTEEQINKMLEVLETKLQKLHKSYEIGTTQQDHEKDIL